MESPPCQPSLLLACDDSTTLEAALAFVGGCDGPPTARDSANARETSAIFASVHELLAEWDHADDQFQEERVQPAVCTQLRNSSNTSSKARRQTPSQEIQQLRLEEYELSTELEKLQFDARREALRIGEGKPHLMAPLVFWQQTAARQNQYRLDSERENRRLRELSNVQKRRAKQLQQVWRRQLDTMELGHAIGSTLQVGNAASRSGLSSEASDVLSELLSEVESVYTGLDGFLAARRRHERDESFFHEYAKSRDVPFEKCVVDHAIWSVLAFHTGQQWRDIVCDYLDATEDTVKVCAHRTMRLPKIGLHLQLRFARRKYHEDNRTVIVTRTLMEPQHLQGQLSLGFSFRETQVHVITRNQASSATSTTIETHMVLTRHTAQDEGLPLWRGWAGGRVARMVWEQSIGKRMRIIDDQLFEEAREIVA